MVKVLVLATDNICRQEGVANSVSLAAVYLVSSGAEEGIDFAEGFILRVMNNGSNVGVGAR